MCHNFAKRLPVIFCLLISAAASAQSSNKENDPYSRFGIGELLNGTNAALRSAGYATTAYSSATIANTDNPASYASLKLTTYEAGLMGSTRTINTGTDKYGTGSASLGYFNVGIPLNKHAAMALGIRPQSRVFYNSVDTGYLQDFGKIAHQFDGEGGLNYIYAGLAGKSHGFSLGVNFGYMFGSIRNTSSLVNLDTTYVLSSAFTRETKIGGIYWKGGAQYETKLSSKMYLQLGLTATLSQQLNADRQTYSSDIRQINSTTQVDTVSYNTLTSGKVTLPLSLSYGARIGGEKWSVMVDYNSTSWNQFRNYDAVDSVADHTSRISIGGEYTPDPTSIRNYLSRVTYRLGFYYGNDYVKLHNTALNYYAVTAGASLPFRRSADRVHIAFEYGARGTTTNNLVKETYFRGTLGISLNALWFVKRPYD